MHTSEVESTRKHAKFGKRLPHYAGLFGQTERTIKRWIRRGKELRELPPLDSPEKMAAWWRRSMDQQVPDYLIGFLPQGAGSAGAAQSAGTLPPEPRNFSEVKGLGIEQNVEELRRSHAINKTLLDDALHAAEPSEQTIMLRQRNYERSFELLRKAETTLIEIKKQTGELVDPEPIRAELAQVFESLRLMRETMPSRIMINLGRMLPRRLQRIFALLEKHLQSAIEKARSDEENIFRNLGSLNGPSDINTLLRA